MKIGRISPGQHPTGPIQTRCRSNSEVAVVGASIPISLVERFELTCAGIIDQPLRVSRLVEAIILATPMGENLDFEIRIFDVDGKRSDVMELKHQPVLAD